MTAVRSLLLAMRAFAAAMFGVRRRAHAEDEHKGLRIGHAIAAGVIMTAIFAAAILAIAELVVGSQP